MALFGRRKITELQAAAEFVQTILMGIREHWPAISGEFRPFFSEALEHLDSPGTQFEFAMAVLAIQMQALPNLLPADQAQRIRSHVFACLSNPELGKRGVEGVQAYEHAWAAAIAEDNFPFDGVASELYDRLNQEETVEVAGARFKDPLLLDAIGGAVTKAGGPWWKRFLAEHRLIA